jgi:hypothetical protein
VVLVEKDKGALSEVKWMATTKLLAVKDFIATALISTMRSVRNVAREVSFRQIVKNLLWYRPFSWVIRST